MQEEGRRVLVCVRWGGPFYKWVKPKKYVTNARADGLLKKAIWKESARQRRCLIPAMGYYEPGLGPEGAKGEILFKVKDHPVFFFAGLWDMPVVLDEGVALGWLGEEPLPNERLLEFCRGLPSEALVHEELPAKLKVPRPAKKKAKPLSDDDQTQLSLF